MFWPGVSVGWNVILYPERLQVDSLSGHIPRLWAQFSVGVCMGGSGSTFLYHIDVSLSLFPLPIPVKISKRILG